MKKDPHYSLGKETNLWIDSHCHLQYLEQWESKLQLGIDAGIEKVICIATDFDSSIEVIRIAETVPDRIWASAGLHPHHANLGTENIHSLVEEESRKENSKVIAIGECGLDYFYNYSSIPDQKTSFSSQIQLANKYDLTLVIHTRDAWDDTFELLRKEGVPKRTVFHCFTGGIEEAKSCLELGAYLSFSGIVTFANAQSLRQAVSICPLDRFIVETDSPFLTPVPFRGKPNDPSFIPIIGTKIAEIKNLTVDIIEEASWKNTCSAFRIE